MKFIQQLLYLNIFLFVISSCRQDDTLCPPNHITPIQANYFKSGIDENKPGIGQSVYFSIPKLHNARYFWDFGDGDVSTRRNPRKIFTEKGNYIVKLRIEQASSDCFDARTIDIQRPLDIGSGLFIKTIRINNINFSKANGQPWDNDESGPDIFLKLGNVFTSPVVENFSIKNLPYEWDLSAYNIPYEAYQLELIDTDSEIALNSQESVNTCNLDNFQLNSESNLATFNDSEQLFEVEITYIIKDSI